MIMANILPEDDRTKSKPENSTKARETASSVYPVFLTHLNTILCVVIGGGAVATRKVRGLLAAQANIRVISPELAPELYALYASGQIAWLKRPYRPGDLETAGLVVGATNLRQVNQAVAQEARTQGILCNVVDAPEEGNFHVPAVHRAPETVVAVGTGGTKPRRAVELRDRIAALLANCGI